MAITDTSTPVLILGGKENSLSLTRHLGRRGIAVRVSGRSSCWGLYSRYCAGRFPVPHGHSLNAFWRALLLGPTKPLKGHIVLPCGDEAIEFIAEHPEELARDYVLDDGRPALRRALLDKKRTLEMARAAGIGAPRSWDIGGEADLDEIRAEARFPLMVKPIHSHKFTRVFGCKLFIIDNSFDELARKARIARGHGLEVMAVEMVPGPDDLLSSYYTYIDDKGEALFRFTKRVLRRFPVNRGNACYHVTEWLPETAALGERFFDAIGFRGLGNIEFKRDRRDGALKLIEVNARFTAAQELLVRAGAPIDLIVYCHLTGQRVPRFETYQQFKRLWYPARDFLAFLELRGRGDLSLAGWLDSVLRSGHVYPLFSSGDPLPSLGAAGALVGQFLRGRR